MIPLLGTAQPQWFRGIGLVQGEAILVFLSAVIGSSIALTVFALLTVLPRLMPSVDRERLNPIPLIAGSALTAIGLATVNLSGAVGGATPSTLPMGIEMLSVGTISLALFVCTMGNKCMVRNVPNYAFLLFLLLLVPAAFLIKV
jgi:hypothetical protein